MVGVWKKFKGIRDQGVKGLNLKIYQGESISIIGHNGSGKTTLINLIAGITKPDQGSIMIKKPAVRVCL